MLCIKYLVKSHGLFLVIFFFTKPIVIHYVYFSINNNNIISKTHVDSNSYPSGRVPKKYVNPSSVRPHVPERASAGRRVCQIRIIQLEKIIIIIENKKNK